MSPGETLGRVASRLEREGLVRSALAFEALARWREQASALQVGEFDLSPAMPPGEILERIAKNKHWMKAEQVRVNLLMNASTPVPLAMRLVPLLPRPILARLYKKRSLPGPVERAIRRIIHARG